MDGEVNPKQAAADRALLEVEDGMLLGLGTGSTAACFIEGLGRLVAGGLSVTCVATSRASAAQAASLGIAVVDSVPRRLDLTVDGADEIDPALNLVKGLGGALLREKVVAAASERMMVIATADKFADHLGRGPLPVEVLPLLWERTADQVGALALDPKLRTTAAEGGEPFVSDNGNLILDCRYTGPRDVWALGRDLEAIPGVVGHGLFLGLATSAALAGADGVRVITRAD